MIDKKLCDDVDINREEQYVFRERIFELKEFQFKNFGTLLSQMNEWMNAWMNGKKLIKRWDSEHELFYDDIFNHFYAVRHGSYRIRWNNAK